MLQNVTTMWQLYVQLYYNFATTVLQLCYYYITSMLLLYYIYVTVTTYVTTLLLLYYMNSGDIVTANFDPVKKKLEAL